MSRTRRLPGLARRAAGRWRGTCQERAGAASAPGAPPRPAPTWSSPTGTPSQALSSAALSASLTPPLLVRNTAGARQRPPRCSCGVGEGGRTGCGGRWGRPGGNVVWRDASPALRPPTGCSASPHLRHRLLGCGQHGVAADQHAVNVERKRGRARGVAARRSARMRRPGRGDAAGPPRRSAACAPPGADQELVHGNRPGHTAVRPKLQTPLQRDREAADLSHLRGVPCAGRQTASCTSVPGFLVINDTQ